MAKLGFPTFNLGALAPEFNVFKPAAPGTFKLKFAPIVQQQISNWQTTFKIPKVQTPAIKAAALNFEKLNVSMVNIGKLLDTKVSSIVLPKIDVSMLGLKTKILNADLSKLPTKTILFNVAQETNNTITNINNILNNDLLENVAREIKNTNVANTKNIGVISKIAIAPKTTPGDKLVILGAIDTSKLMEKKAIEQLNMTAINMNTTLKLKASDEIVAAIAKRAKITNPADQILLKNIVNIKLGTSPEIEKAIILNKATFDQIKLRTDDAGIFINNFAGNTIKPSTAPIKAHFEMVYDLKTMEPALVNFLIKERFISNVERETTQILSHKTVDGKTMFSALLEYKSQNPASTAPTQLPTLTTTLLGPTGPGAVQKVIGTVITPPIPTKAIEFKQQTTPTPTKPGGEWSLANYIRQHPTEKAADIAKIFYPTLKGSELGNVVQNVQSALNNPEENIYEGMERTYMNINTGRFEITPTGYKTLTQEQKAVQAEAGKLEYAAKYGQTTPIAAAPSEKTTMTPAEATRTKLFTEATQQQTIAMPDKTFTALKIGENALQQQKRITQNYGLTHQFAPVLVGTSSGGKTVLIKNNPLEVKNMLTESGTQKAETGEVGVIQQLANSAWGWFLSQGEAGHAQIGVNNGNLIAVHTKVGELPQAKAQITTLGEFKTSVLTDLQREVNLLYGYDPNDIIVTSYIQGKNGANLIDAAIKGTPVAGMNADQTLASALKIATPQEVERISSTTRGAQALAVVRGDIWEKPELEAKLTPTALKNIKAQENTDYVKNRIPSVPMQYARAGIDMVLSPFVTGDPAVDIPLFILTEVGAGTAIKGTTKLGRVLTKETMSGIRGTADLVNYMKEAKITIPTRLQTTLGETLGSALISKTPIARTNMVQVPVLIRIGGDTANPTIATHAMNIIKTETKIDAAKTANLLNEHIGTIAQATPTSPPMIITRADIRNLLANAGTASTNPEFEAKVMQNLENIWKNTERPKIEPTVMKSTDTSKTTRISYGMLPTIKMPNSLDVETLRNAALDRDITTKTIRIPTENNYAKNLRQYIETNDVYKVPNVGYVKIESVGTDSIKARIATNVEVKDAANKFAWEYGNEDYLGNSIKDSINTKLAALDNEKRQLNIMPEETVTTFKGKTTTTTTLRPNAEKITKINERMKNLATYMTDEEAKIFDISDDMNIDVVDLPEFIGKNEIPLTLGAQKADKLEIQLLDIEKLEKEGKKLTITEKELWELPINQETKNVILTKYSHMLLPDTMKETTKTIEKTLPHMTIGVETPMKGLGLKAISLPRIVGKTEDVTKLGNRIESIVLESADFAKLQNEIPESADIIRKALGYGDTGNKEVAKLVTESNAWKTLDPKVKEWTTAAVDAKLTKSTGVPSEWTINKALTNAKNLNYENAAKTLKTIDPTSAKKLKTIADTKDISLRQIGELEAHGVNKNIVLELKNARKENAILDLDKKGLSETVAKLREGRALTSTEVDALWKERDIVQDALYKSDNELAMKTKLYEVKANDINTRATKLMDAGTTAERAALKEERTAFRKAIDDETTKCKTQSPLTGGCSPGGAARSGTTLAAVGAGALIGGAVLATTQTADGKKWIYNQQTNTYAEITPIGPKVIAPNYVVKQAETGSETVNKNILPAYNKLMKSYIPGMTYKKGVEGTLDPNEQNCQDFAIKAADLINSDTNLKNQGLQAKVVTLIGTITQAPVGNNDEYKVGDQIGHAAIIIENTKNQIGSYIDPTSGKTIPMYEQTIVEPQTGQTGETGTDITNTEMRLGNYHYNIEATQEMKSGEKKLVYQYDINKKVATTVPTSPSITTITETPSPGLQKSIDLAKQYGANETILEIAKIDPYWTQGVTPKIQPALPKMNIGV